MPFKVEKKTPCIFRTNSIINSELLNSYIFLENFTSFSISYVHFLDTLQFVVLTNVCQRKKDTLNSILILIFWKPWGCVEPGDYREVGKKNSKIS